MYFKLKSKDFNEVISTLEDSKTIEIKCTQDKGIIYVLKATNINLQAVSENAKLILQL